MLRPAPLQLTDIHCNSIIQRLDMLGQLEIVCIGAFGTSKIKDAEYTRELRGIKTTICFKYTGCMCIYIISHLDKSSVQYSPVIP